MPYLILFQEKEYQISDKAHRFLKVKIEKALETLNIRKGPEDTRAIFTTDNNYGVVTYPLCDQIMHEFLGTDLEGLVPYHENIPNYYREFIIPPETVLSIESNNYISN